MFDFLYKRPLGRHNIIKDVVESESENYFERLNKLENSFYKSFFEECINSTIADAYEYFTEFRTVGNIFSENVYEMTREKGRRFIKLMAIYHSIKMLRYKKCSLNIDDMKRHLFYIFDLCESEQKMFDLLYACAVMYSWKFYELFSFALMKYVFGKEKYGLQTIAFIQIFCYNSFNTMFESFTKYLSLEQRLQGAS